MIGQHLNYLKVTRYYCKKTIKLNFKTLQNLAKNIHIIACITFGPKDKSFFFFLFSTTFQKSLVNPYCSSMETFYLQQPGRARHLRGGKDGGGVERGGSVGGDRMAGGGGRVER